MNKQKQYFINGLILIVIAVLTVTVIPLCIDKLKIAFEKNVFSDIELFVLMTGALFYLFSPKYYKMQVISILGALIFYLLFVRFYFS